MEYEKRADCPQIVCVDEISTKIISQYEKIPCEQGLPGGFAVTGFIDVEKLISIKSYQGEVENFFLEKKFPFSILVLKLDNNKR